MGNMYASLFVIVCLCWPVLSRVLTEATINETNAVLTASQIFPTLPIVILGSANEKCRTDSQLLLDNLRNSTIWAAQMLDASAKSVQGLYMGSFYQLGNFRECVMTEIPIQGKFCVATLTTRPPALQPVNFNADIYNPFESIWNKIGHEGDRAKAARNMVYYAMCIPASCSHSDLETSITRQLAATSSNNTISVEVKSKLCQTNRKEETLSDGSIAYCIVMAAIVLLVIVSTICDNNTYSFEGDNPQQEAKIECDKSDGYVQIFSLKKNLFELNKYSRSRLGSLYGIKFLSTCGVILAHRGLLCRASPLQNYEDIFEKANTVFGWGVYYQTETIVDSFFLISGILLAFIMLRHLEKNTINPIQMIIYRYLRLTPVYALVVFFPATLMFHLGNGPLWTAIMDTERQYCVQNWWSNLLYVNNYVNDDQMCMFHSWYMAPEFHYYVISTFLVLLIYKHPLCGYIILGITTAASLIVPFAITYIYKLDPVQFFYADQVKLGRSQPYFRFMYSKSHVHATPYFVGVATGLILYRLRNHHVKYTWQSTLGVGAGILISACSLIPGALMINRTWNYSEVFAALEQPQRRLFWSLGIAVVIMSLTFSKNSIVNTFLSSQMMSLLSKLCYSAYLASLCLQLMDVGAVKGPLELTINAVIRWSLADICLSFAVAFVLYLTVEAPMDNLVTKLLKRKSGKTSSKA